MRKLLWVAIAATLIIGATPALAQLAGTWAGVGKGEAYPPSGEILYPWQHWKGFIPDDEGSFSGKWYDGNGNHGRFEGKPAPSSTPEIKSFKGYWTWETEAGIIKAGEFVMDFYYLEGYCKGKWTSIWPSPGLPGVMKGEKVE